jgi:hypothetical protein
MDLSNTKDISGFCFLVRIFCTDFLCTDFLYGSVQRLVRIWTVLQEIYHSMTVDSARKFKLGRICCTDFLPEVTVRNVRLFIYLSCSLTKYTVPAAGKLLTE